MKKHNILSEIEQFTTAHNLIQQGSKIILGLSGGPDSIFLLHFLGSLHHQGSISLIAAHLDHGWRPESADDVLFCKEQCQNLNIPFITQRLSDLSFNTKFNGSQEEVGRNARRYFFEKLAQEKLADIVALAHHMQDQQETFLMRLIRGSSLSGLVGMRPKSGIYIRPLLSIQKEDILTYLHEEKIPYLIDPTNESQIYLRNRIRSKIVPELNSADSRFNQNFLQTIERLQATENFLEDLTQKTFHAISAYENNRHQLDIQKFLSLHEIMKYRVLVHWLVAENLQFPPSQSFFDEMIKFFSSTESKTHQIHHDWKLVKKKNNMSIDKN